jgi:hypothetical protein
MMSPFLVVLQSIQNQSLSHWASCQAIYGVFVGYTVDSLMTHTPRWTPQAMGYEGVWGLRNVLKIGPKKSGKFSNMYFNACRAISGAYSRVELCTAIM